jgi:manganese-dependent inorganic pyrophosphatase
MSESIYVIGHKSPDLDSVASAIAYSLFRNQVDNSESYVPAVAGRLNRETEYALQKFGFPKPGLLESAEGKNLILVDHNESGQAVNGIDNARIIAVLDHHKIEFKSREPIYFESRPWGATCTIIANKYLKKNIEIEPGLAGLMLSAILVDTVITKSPTCTSFDVGIIGKLSGKAKITDWKDFGMELFKIRSSVKELSSDEIIRSDFKDFDFKCGKFGIGQVETADLSEFSGREDELVASLQNILDEGGYHSVILFITDIIKEGSKFYIATKDQEKIESAIGAKLEDNKAYIDGIISRKKQVIPMFSKVFD